MGSIDKNNHNEGLQKINKLSKHKNTFKHLLVNALFSLGIYQGCEYLDRNQSFDFLKDFTLNVIYEDGINEFKRIFGSELINFNDLDSFVDIVMHMDSNIDGILVYNNDTNTTQNKYGNINNYVVNKHFISGDNGQNGFSFIHVERGVTFLYYKITVNNIYEIYIRYIINFDDYISLIESFLPSGYNITIKNNYGHIMYQTNDDNSGEYFRVINNPLFSVELSKNFEVNSSVYVLIFLFFYWSIVVFSSGKLNYKDNKTDLKNSEILNETLENTKICVVQLNKEGIILKVNNSFLTKIGYERQELIGRSILDLISQDCKENILQKNSLQRVSLLSKFGKVIHTMCSITNNSYIAENELYIFCVDISDMVYEIDKFKLEIAKCEKNTKTLESRFSKEVHDLRSPLQGIVSLTEILGDTNLDQFQKECNGTISCSSNFMLSLINNILDNTKLKEGRMKFDNSELNIVNVIEEVYFILKTKANEKGIKFVLKINSTNIPIFMGDKTQIQKILLNLISNAIKFTPIDGDVLVSLLINENDEVVIVVKDNGIGMNHDHLDVLFDEYTQFSSQSSGTGLGMSITKGLVELMGGKIDVESSFGEGTTITVKLPLFKTNKTISNESLIDVSITSKTEKVDNNIWKGKRILVVDDNSINRFAANNIIKSFSSNTHVFSVGSGEEALEALSNGSFDLILLDIHMPIMNGYEFSEIVKKEKGIDIGVIAVTGDVLDPEYKDNFHNLLIKPYKADNLIKIINNYSVLMQTVKDMPTDESDDNNFEPVLNVNDSINSIVDIPQFESIIAFSDYNALKIQIVESINNSVLKINDFFEKEDYDKFFEEIYSFKGSMGNIGAKTIFRVCLDIENNKNDMLELNRLYSVLLKEVNNFLRVLDKLDY